MPKVKRNPLIMFYHLVRNDAHKLETDPTTQWRYHRHMSWYWLLNFPVVGYLYFYQPHLWVSVGLLLNTFYSLYANFATEYGAIPSSYAAMNTEKMANKTAEAQAQLQDQVEDVADDVDDLHDAAQQLGLVEPDEAPAPDPRRIHVFSEA